VSRKLLNSFMSTMWGLIYFCMYTSSSFHNLYLDLVYFQQDVKGFCETYHQHEIPSGLVVFYETSHSFIAGLASYQAYRETGDFLWYERGKKRLDEMKIWAEQGAAWNFSHKLSLLTAEDCFCLGDLDNAKQAYKQAISTADAHRFVNDSAIGKCWVSELHALSL
jgi:hypothetical protein